VRVEITFPSEHMFLGVPDAVIQELGSELPFTANELDELSTSVIEACTNAIEHGNRLQSEIAARVRFDFTPERFEVTVYDKGKGFDYETRDFSAFPKDIMQERGRGLYMMHTFCDELRFARSPEGFAVTLVKIPRGNGAPAE
jgi:serine/threonine-protein kinase RsbW